MDFKELIVYKKAYKLAMECNYLEREIYSHLLQGTDEIGRLLNFMIQYPEKFGCKNE
jgi:hypothetical protein